MQQKEENFLFQVPSHMKKIRRFSACNLCRESKKKCDRKHPCSRCSQKGVSCFYTANRKSIARDDQLFDVTTRRRYIEAYLEGVNPFILFSKVSVSTFDNPTTDAKRLQYNAILASSTRSFGVPKSIYEHFEREAKRLASTLKNEYTFDAALGFNLLSYHLWGDNNTLSLECKEITKEICLKSMTMERNYYDFEKLKVLHCTSLGINQLNNPYKIEQEMNNFIPNNNENSNSPELYQFVSLRAAAWAIFHSYLDRYIFAYEGTNNPFNKLDHQIFLDLCKVISVVEVNFQPHLQTPLPTLLIRAAAGMLKSLIFYVGENLDASFFALEEAICIFTLNNYLIGMGGPQYIILFHSVFVMSLKEKKYDFANRINKLQQKQKEIFPAACEFVNKDTEALNNYFAQQRQKEKIFTSIPSNSVPLTSNDQTSSFYWMSSVPIPILSNEESNESSIFEKGNQNEEDIWGFKQQS